MLNSCFSAMAVTPDIRRYKSLPIPFVRHAVHRNYISELACSTVECSKQRTSRNGASSVAPFRPETRGHHRYISRLSEETLISSTARRLPFPINSGAYPFLIFTADGIVYKSNIFDGSTVSHWDPTWKPFVTRYCGCSPSCHRYNFWDKADRQKN